MQFIDSHAHLGDPAFDQDRDELITTRLPQAGICACVEIGCAPDEWQPTLALAGKYPAFIKAVLGAHPEYATSFDAQTSKQLAELLKDARVLAVGETGLDYTCLDQANKDAQHQAFIQQITLADQTQKPLILHVRRADENYDVYTDTFACLKHHWHAQSHTKYPGVLHCFCARYEEAARALDNGLLLGINGCFTYKKNEYIREAVKKAGADKIILETDCPYLSPQGKRGLRNDPSNIPLLAQWVADYLNMPLEDLAQITTRNARKLYGLK